uniref:Uncharacterized protein n=1 Tax=Panagrolaimus sp. JU765 TaxID=591449 RepID=A0AC34QNS3_9BILA
MISFPKRLWDSKPIMSVVESMPKLSYDLFYDLMNSVLIPIVRVIPNAIINGVGPVVHECGSLLNFLINENVTAPERVWFHYSLSIMLGDRKNRKLEYLTDEELAGIMKSLKEELEKTGTFKNAVDEELAAIMKSLKEEMEKTGTFKNAVGRNQRMSKKLVLEMTTANAKVTLLFCTPIALKRSYLIRSYRRVDDRLQQLAYLFTILTQTNPDLALLTNSPLCHLLIFYLQVYGYIDVLHEKIPEDVIEVDIFSLVDIPDERLLGCRNNELADIPVSLMLYECAEFYARFNYEYAIDIAVNEAKKRRTYHDYRRYSKDPIFIPCAYSDCNIASGITRKCFGSFMKMMENIMDKFMKGKEAELFENNLLELAKSGGNVPFV